MRTAKTIGSTVAGLTASQFIILRHAFAGPIRMCRGDRRGTRCVSYDDMGHANMVAYSNPEFFLERRGLLRKRNERHCYDITDAGRALIVKRMLTS